MRYQLFREQLIKSDINKVWDFFSSPYNLAKITPPDMGFTVRSNDVYRPIFTGMCIDYTVSPLLGIPMKWRTRITQVEPMRSFTDFQERGPYKYWNHFHEFLVTEEGVLVKDTVCYELPLGVLGNVVHALIVEQKLKNIFDYRFDVLEKQFNLKLK